MRIILCLLLISGGGCGSWHNVNRPVADGIAIWGTVSKARWCRARKQECTAGDTESCRMYKQRCP